MVRGARSGKYIIGGGVLFALTVRLGAVFFFVLAIFFPPQFNLGGKLPPDFAILKVRVRHFAAFTHGDKPAVAIGDGVDVSRS